MIEFFLIICYVNIDKKKNIGWKKRLEYTYEAQNKKISDNNVFGIFADNWLCASTSGFGSGECY